MLMQALPAYADNFPVTITVYRDGTVSTEGIYRREPLPKPMPSFKEIEAARERAKEGCRDSRGRWMWPCD
jgi:hypothetical protein